MSLNSRLSAAYETPGEANVSDGSELSIVLTAPVTPERRQHQRRGRRDLGPAQRDPASSRERDRLLERLERRVPKSCRDSVELGRERAARLAAREVSAEERLLELGQLAVEAQRCALACPLTLLRQLPHDSHTGF